MDVWKTNVYQQTDIEKRAMTEQRADTEKRCHERSNSENQMSRVRL